MPRPGPRRGRKSWRRTDEYGLWKYGNLARNREIPTFPQPSSGFRQTKTTLTYSVPKSVLTMGSTLDREVSTKFIKNSVPLRDRCSFGRFPWLISQALSVTYMAGERRLYLERNCRLPESPAHSRRRNREGPASSKGLNSQRGFGPAVEPRRKSRPRSTSLHGSSPCKCQRLSTLRWDRLPPSRPSTKSGARAGGRRLSDRRLHRWLAGTSASAPSSHGAADLLGLNRAHICVRNQKL